MLWPLLAFLYLFCTGAWETPFFKSRRAASRMFNKGFFCFLEMFLSNLYDNKNRGGIRIRDFENRGEAYGSEA